MKAYQFSSKIKFIAITLLVLLVFTNMYQLSGNVTMINAQAATLQKLKLGDYIKFGKYNGDPIVWRIININKDGTYLIYSEKILCLKAYDAKGDLAYGLGDINRVGSGSNYWRLSSIREWLNSTSKNVDFSCLVPDAAHVDDGNPYDKEAGFLSNFSQTELSAIKVTTNKCILASADKSVADGGKFDPGSDPTKSTLSLLFRNYNTAYYENVQDYVFFLDQMELSTYFTMRKWDYSRMPTKKAVDNSTVKDPGSISSKLSMPYWTRSADVGTTNNIWGVGKSNFSTYNGYASKGKIGVVPALTLKKEIKIMGGNGSANNPMIVTGINAPSTSFTLAPLAKSPFTASVPKYKLNYLLEGSNSGQYPITMNENRIAAGSDSAVRAAYWDELGKMHQMNTLIDNESQSNWKVNTINNKNVAISSVAGLVWTTLTGNPKFINRDRGAKPDLLYPVRILDSGALVGNAMPEDFVYGISKNEDHFYAPAYLENMNATKPTYMRAVKGWIHNSLSLPNETGLQSVAANGAAVGFEYLTKEKPTLYYWANLTAEPTVVTLPEGLDYTKGYFFPMVNSKGEIIANWMTKSGDDPRSYYYANPKAKPVQLTDKKGYNSSKSIYLAGINDNGDIVGKGVDGATIWRNKTPYPLTDLTDMDKDKDQHLGNPICINNNGDIVVLYTSSTTQCYAVVSLKH